MVGLRKPVLTYDTEGSLERVHIGGTNQCNLERKKAPTRKDVTWAECFEAVSLATHLDEDAGVGFCDTSDYQELLCDWCFGR